MNHRHLWPSLNSVVAEVRNRGLRYLLAAAWNTFFGWASFAILYRLLHPWVHYLVLAILAGVVSITMSYTVYRTFVFRSTIPWWTGYLRCYLVYGGVMLLGWILLPFLVETIRLHPYVAQAVSVATTATVSYLAHDRFTFRALKRPHRKERA